MHLLLSGDDENIIIGNYIADHIRGSKVINAMPEGIIKGVMLHRTIDRYSDTHARVKHSVNLLTPHLYLYAHVSVDILYDYFLIKHWKQFSKKNYDVFVDDFYKLLESRIDILPVKSQKITRTMLDEDWFDMYKDFEGLNHVFKVMSKRASFKSNMENTTTYFLHYYNAIEEDFLVFAKDIVKFIYLHKLYEQ